MFVQAGGGGGMEVHNTHHTCTAWYAYATLFASSISYTHLSLNGVGCMYNLSIVLSTRYPH